MTFEGDSAARPLYLRTIGSALIVVTVNFMVDIAYAYLDPRIRLH